MGATLRRAAYSTNIKTRGDFSCAFFDRDLRTIAQAFAQPSHLGSLAHIVPRAIATYGAERLAPGDGILINDPYLGGVHLNDITLITPVFHEGALFGYVANIAHHVDVGGGAPGSIGVSSEIYQEGLVIPPVRFVKGGQIDRDLFAMIRSNFRGTREISGDFRAQTAANRLGAQRIEALAAQHGARHADPLPRRAAALHRAAHPGRLRGVPRRPLHRRHAHGRRRGHRPAGAARGDRDHRAGAACRSISPAATTSASRRPTRPRRRPTPAWCTCSSA